jgi:hypothetical protein
MYCSIGSQRMWWYRSNQHVLRAELYSGIADEVQQGDTDGSAIGFLWSIRCIVSFTASFCIVSIALPFLTVFLML